MHYEQDRGGPWPPQGQVCPHLRRFPLLSKLALQPHLQGRTSTQLMSGPSGATTMVLVLTHMHVHCNGWKILSMWSNNVAVLVWVVLLYDRTRCSSFLSSTLIFSPWTLRIVFSEKNVVYTIEYTIIWKTTNHVFVPNMTFIRHNDFCSITYMLLFLSVVQWKHIKQWKHVLKFIV